ncbi:hypothetical protein N8590_03000 [bacterium]|jgi:hypothetical protein|nr:hypothetical protein [bacterium]MDB4731577.1 hypothetical protein [bacterium]
MTSENPTFDDSVSHQVVWHHSRWIRLSLLVVGICLLYLVVVYISKAEERLARIRVGALDGGTIERAITIPIPFFKNVLLPSGEIKGVVLNGAHVKDKDIIPILEALPDLTALHLDSCSVTDKTLAAIKDRPIVELSLVNTLVTDEGMASIVSIPNPMMLSLRNADITDYGLLTLGKGSFIGRLDLNGTKITDSGLLQFAKSGCSATLSVKDTAVTAVGIQEALSLNPNLNIEQ